MLAGALMLAAAGLAGGLGSWVWDMSSGEASDQKEHVVSEAGSTPAGQCQRVLVVCMSLLDAEELAGDAL